MSSVQEMQRVDRELFLELIESPINPAFLHMSTPLKRYDPMFYLQINDEALWQWRVVKNPKQMFEVLQDNFVFRAQTISSVTYQPKKRENAAAHDFVDKSLCKERRPRLN